MNKIKQQRKSAPLEIRRQGRLLVPNGTRFLTGFALIEMLIYIALFSIIIGGGMIAAYGIIQGSDKTSAKTITEQEGLFLLRKFNWALTGATAVSVPVPSQLKVTKGSIINFTLNNTAVEMDGMPLNGANVKISNLTFVKITAIEKPDGIRVSFIATGTRGNNQIFEATKYLR